jgi:hypothetical protein
VVAQAGGPQGKAGAWLSVFVILAGFIIGTIALIAHNSVILWIIAGVVLVIGGILTLTSRIMELGH